MRISELMSREVITINEDRTCDDAIRLMCRARVRHLPVLDAEGALVGIVTDRDLRQRLFAPNVYSRLGRIPVATLLREARIRDVMSAPVLCIDPAAEVSLAAERMRADKVGWSPRGTKVVGIITEIDLLRRAVGTEAARDPALEIRESRPGCECWRTPITRSASPRLAAGAARSACRCSGKATSSG